MWAQIDKERRVSGQGFCVVVSTTSDFNAEQFWAFWIIGLSNFAGVMEAQIRADGFVLRCLPPARQTVNL